MPPVHGGPLPAPVAAAFSQGLFNLSDRGQALGTSAAQWVWRVPVIMVSYSDSALTYSAQDFNRSLFDTLSLTPTGSVYDYYRWVSGGRMRVIGQVVATITLPNSRHYYANSSFGLDPISTPENAFGMVRDALFRADAQVDWNAFDSDHDGYVDMLWVVHAGVGGEGTTDRDNLWSIVSRMSTGWNNGAPFVTHSIIPGTQNQPVRVDRFSIMPELSSFVAHRQSEIGVFCHEFGHALGLPDLYDTSGRTNVGPGIWSLMSSGVYGGDGASPQFPSHLGAWSMLFLGWAQKARPVHDSLITMTPIERGGPVTELWFQGEDNPEHFLIENRHAEGFDRRLPQSGLVVYHVDDELMGQGLGVNRVNAGPIMGLRVVEADGDSDLVLGHNHGDASDPFPGSLERTFVSDDTRPNLRSNSGAITNLALRDISLSGDDVRFTAQVRAPGWLPTEDFTPPGYQPFDASGPAARSAIDADGTVYTVRSEQRAGRAQIVLRSRLAGGPWDPPLQISQTTGAAIEPTLALLQGSDLALVWTDTRGVRSQLWYRARIHGGWSAERALTDQIGESRSPALATDGRGLLYLSWLYTVTDRPQVMLMRFTWFSPFGQPMPVSPITDLPSAPGIAVGQNGVAYLLWTDRSSLPLAQPAIWLARFNPDSGVSAKDRLTASTAYAEPSFWAVVDSLGALHTVWQVSGPGIQEIHYQKRPPDGPPIQPDTTLDAFGGDVQNPVLAIDPRGGLHLVYEASTGGAQTLLYKHWQTGRGWDFRSTEVTEPADGIAAQATVLPTSPGSLTVLFTGYDAIGSPRFRERRRNLDGVILAAPGPGVSIARAALSLGPNPLYRGQALEVRWHAGSTGLEPAVNPGAARAPAPRVDFFDVAGRRLATVLLPSFGPERTARLPAAATASWPSGLYFARLRGADVMARLVLLR